VAVARAAGCAVVPVDNVGFGRGCNIGMEHVRAPVTALLNPDVELLDGSVLAAAAEVSGPGAERVLAPLVLTPQGQREDSAHPVPASAPDLAATLLPHRRAPAALVPWRSNRPRRVGWAVGAALIARSETFRRLGPFDERIFLYGEDLDLGLRAAEAGVETWFWPHARVLHRRSHASVAAFGGEPVERLMAARREVVARRLGPRRAALDDAAQIVMFGSRLVARAALGRESARQRRLLAARLRARRDRAG
jgi:GT2 family glycosyltransferase